MSIAHKGMLVTIEGIDGAGKSTLAHNLKNLLNNKNMSVVLTKEPGATLLGQKLRTIVQEKSVPVDALAEYLLFAADRAQHFTDVIIPNLHNNNIVISDRMADSSLAYQGYGRGLDKDMINKVNNWAMRSIQPDVVLYIQLPFEVALERLKKRKNLTSFEQEKADFFKKVIQGFDDILQQRNNVVVLDGTQSPELITQQTFDVIHTWINKNTP